MDAQTFADVMGRALPLARYEALLPAWNAALTQADCTNINRVSMLAAQVGHESGGLRWMNEIASGAAYEGRKDLGNIYPGDGTRFRGHGPIQITGRSNHSAVSKWAADHGYVPTGSYFVDHPAELGSDRYGFLGVVWYWTVARSRLNAMADVGDIVGCTKAINGGTNGLADRKARYVRALTLGQQLLPTPTEDAVNWRVARALDALLAQLNAYAPRRSKVSDGSIGDAAHASRDSDHNPWYGPGIVTARDFTHDPVGGLDCQKLAAALVRSGDVRIKYTIWNRQIWEKATGWEPYKGENPHTKHLHLSVVASPLADSTTAWNLPGISTPNEEDDMNAEQDARLTRLEQMMHMIWEQLAGPGADPLTKGKEFTGWPNLPGGSPGPDGAPARRTLVDHVRQVDVELNNLRVRP